jgi:DNA-binding IclR family transcriptional regulator
MLNLHTATRTAVRATLIQNGPQTCSEIVRGMGMNPSKHKGTVHAIMVEMEREGILDATRGDNGKRDLWYILPTAIRKRDRIVAALIG